MPPSNPSPSFKTRSLLASQFKKPFFLMQCVQVCIIVREFPGLQCWTLTTVSCKVVC